MNQVQKTVFLPPPVQTPRIPVWVGGFWPNKGPFRRAARWDGVMPLKMEGWWLTPEDVKAVLAYIAEHRTSKAPFDIAIIGSRDTTGKGGARGAKKVAMLAEAGATWWLETLYLQRNSLERLQAAIRMGPPK